MGRLVEYYDPVAAKETFFSKRVDDLEPFLQSLHRENRRMGYSGMFPKCCKCERTAYRIYKLTFIGCECHQTKVRICGHCILRAFEATWAVDYTGQRGIIHCPLHQSGYLLQISKVKSSSGLPRSRMSRIYL